GNRRMEEIRSSQNGPMSIEGYADQLSYWARDRIGFQLSTSAPSYSVEIARLGHGAPGKPFCAGSGLPRPADRRELAGPSSRAGRSRQKRERTSEEKCW